MVQLLTEVFPYWFCATHIPPIHLAKHQWTPWWVLWYYCAPGRWTHYMTKQMKSIYGDLNFIFYWHRVSRNSVLTNPECMGPWQGVFYKCSLGNTREKSPSQWPLEIVCTQWDKPRTLEEAYHLDQGLFTTWGNP